MRALRYFRHRRNEVMVFHLLDKNELEFPFRANDRVRRYRGARRSRILADPRAIRAAYLQQLQAFIDEYRRACRRETH